MNNTETESRVAELAAFISEQIGAYDVSITRATLIEDDLGVTGADADELILAFSEKYNVDITEFNFLKYFYDEPTILDIIGLNGRKVEPFTVAHLEKAIIAGRLDEKIINS